MGKSTDETETIEMLERALEAARGNALIGKNNPFALEYLSDIQETVLDLETLNLINIVALWKTVNHTKTSTGGATLLRSLVHPPTSLELVHAKQESLREIMADDRLRRALEDCLNEFGKGEEEVYKVMQKRLGSFGQYRNFRIARKTCKNLADTVTSIPKPQSSYLAGLLQQICSFRDSETYPLMEGPLYRTLRGIKSQQSIGFFTPHWKMVPRHVTSLNMLPLILYAGTAYAMKDAVRGLQIGINQFLIGNALSLAMVGFCAALYITLGKSENDTLSAIYPMAQKACNDRHFTGAIHAVGQLDELLSFYYYAKSLPVSTIPNIGESQHHYLNVVGAVNPILGKRNLSFVPNDVDLTDTRLLIITGPNSGGKTTLCNTLETIQVVGQDGGPVPAQEVNMGIADIIAYQAPAFDSLTSPEGRFGFEQVRTRDIFYKVTPHSLWVMDELAEGTTAEEKLYISTYILSSLLKKHTTAILVTHNHDLAETLSKTEGVQCIQMLFEGDKPTYRAGPGISTTSHASAVTKKIGFSEEDIKRHLIEKGFI